MERRDRVLLPLVRGAIRRIPNVDAVVEGPITYKKRHALLVGILQLECGSITGHRRRSAEIQLVQDAHHILEKCIDVSNMASDLARLGLRLSNRTNFRVPNFDS
ncbi:unnamed protein product [Protopolystoma xenopodis]|uniref:Uncharacterized protein n=1 Tax=Protopolystoma xenopodis TaxID=117903 RepID=A0A3S5FC61_9PLAT|nr:unnamed protein product [Protopolystoma xenopodis]